jgi:hypothetical protein
MPLEFGFGVFFLLQLACEWYCCMFWLC